MIRWMLLSGGVFNFLVAVFHLFFWKLFDWPAGLACLSVENRGMIQVFNVITILILLFFSAVSIFCIDQLRKSGLGSIVLSTVALFWLIRAAAEIILCGDIGNILSLVIILICLAVSSFYLMPLIPACRKSH